MRRIWLVPGLVGLVVGVGVGLGLGPLLVDKAAGYCYACKESLLWSPPGVRAI